MPHASHQARIHYNRKYAKIRRQCWVQPGVDTVRSMFSYDVDLGAIYSRLSGKRVGKRSSGEYRVVYLLGKWVPEHRLIWVLHYGEWPSALIDHINGITCDNRISNLRLALPTNNQANTKLRVDNGSGVRGVSKTPKGWMSYLDHGGRRVHSQQHTDMASAVIARRDAVKRYCGEFSSRAEFSTSGVVNLRDAAKLLAMNGCTAEQIVLACDCHVITACNAVIRYGV